MWTFTFHWKMKCFLYRGLRHVAGKGLQRTWEVKVIVTGACEEKNILLWKKDETCVLHFHFLSCLWLSCMVVTIVVTVSHAGSLSGSRADLLSVASWQTSDKDGGEISHVCHRSDGVISSNLAQSDVAEKKIPTWFCICVSCTIFLVISYLFWGLR